MATRGRPPHPDILTPREWEVFELVREGLNNPQIAERLEISRDAVKYHVSEILGKLSLSSREEAAAWDPRQRPDWTPRWDPTQRPAWATALAPFGFFWRRLAGGLAHSAGSLATVTSVGLGVALVAGITIFAVAVVRTSGSSDDASATPPKIAFLSRRDGNQEIYVMNADGSGQTNVTNGPGDDSFGAWSPDGSRIAFASDRDGNWEIYVVNADGSSLTNLTKDPGDDGVRPNEFGVAESAVAWSPDGSRIAFISNRDGNGGEIYVMAADGSGQTNLTNSPAVYLRFAWSPDGSRIAVFSVETDTEGHVTACCFYVMNADGSGRTNLTNYPGDSVPVWSPDSSRFAFVWGTEDGNRQISVMNADGSGQTRLSNNPGLDKDAAWSPKDAAWSPDGSRIAFDSDRDGNSEIYVMSADGSGQTNLTNDPYLDFGPAWSPDGSRIAFSSLVDGNSEIYVMNADGSGQTNLTNNPGEDYDPAWSPAP